MSVQKGLFWLGGVVSFSVGYAIVYTLGDAIMMFGLLIMVTALFFNWENDENNNE